MLCENRKRENIYIFKKEQSAPPPKTQIEGLKSPPTITMTRGIIKTNEFAQENSYLSMLR